jgi:hypothetical protein
MSGRRVFFLSAGSMLALLALALVVAGASLLWVHSAKRDSDGYYSSRAEHFETTGSAIVSDNLDVGTDGPDWLFDDGRLATIRLRGSSEEAGKDIFIGVARTEQLKAYLAGAPYDVVTDFELDPFRVDYRREEGSGGLEPPGEQTFWAVSAEGAPTETLRWEVEKGNWSAVVMNADASPGVAADLSFGAKVGFIFWTGLGLLIIGVLMLVGAAVFIYFGARKPREPAATAPAAPEPG